MADEAAMEEAPPVTEKRRGLAIPVAIGAACLLLGVGGTLAGVYFTVGLGGETAAAVPEEGAAASAVGSLPVSTSMTGIEVVPLEVFKANLNDGSGGRKISLDISLEGRSLDGKSQFSSSLKIKEAAIRDTVNMLLMDFTFAELRGSDGMRRLRDTIHQKIDAHLADMGVRVDRVYFTDVHFN
ncbi:MAG: hypothetical protein CL927_20715 [Deltaproteobacteria bacterium]|nr:hypothetical protein [Deltaproteobacteria bacterium]